MTLPLTVESEVHFRRRGKGWRRQLEAGPAPTTPPFTPGRVPRIARLMALAIRFADYLRTGQITTHSELAVLGQVSRPRISQVMNLLNLAPDIQEAILFLPLTMSGRDPIHLRQLQAIASDFIWHRQRKLWIQVRDAGLGTSPAK
jgi:hypothetical protein